MASCSLAGKPVTMRWAVLDASRVCSVDDQVSGFGREHRRQDGFLLAHLPDAEHVRILTQRVEDAGVE